VWYLKPDGTKTNCSGFAITTTEVITNYHCLSDPKQLRYVKIGFSYENGVPQYLSRKVIRFASVPSKGLDYSVLELDHPVSDDFVSTIRTTPVAGGEALILMQHPDGLKKMIVTNGCVVSAQIAPDTVVAGSDYSHKCDSTDGSSGSPLMDAKGYVVGLHHLEQYDDKSKSYYNMAVNMSNLLGDLGGNSGGKSILPRIKRVP
jgi:Trypsin-like peptidase domain